MEVEKMQNLDEAQIERPARRWYTAELSDGKWAYYGFNTKRERDERVKTHSENGERVIIQFKGIAARLGSNCYVAPVDPSTVQGEPKPRWQVHSQRRKR